MFKASRVLVPVFLALVAFAVVGQDAPVTSAQKSAGSAITAELLRSHVRFLASDLLEGRGPATRGDQLAEAYIQAQREGLGLAPGAPGGGWIQKVPLVGIRRTSSEPAVFKSGRGTLSGTLGEDFVAVSGVQKPESRIDAAEIVFVGYGIAALGGKDLDSLRVSAESRSFHVFRVRRGRGAGPSRLGVPREASAGSGG